MRNIEQIIDEVFSEESPKPLPEPYTCEREWRRDRLKAAFREARETGTLEVNWKSHG